MDKRDDEILQELGELNCKNLLHLQGKNCLGLPEQAYFSNNLQKISEKALLFPYYKNNVFQIPEGYFDELELSLDEIISDNYTEEITPYSFEKERVNLPYQVPTGYFENFKSVIDFGTDIQNIKPQSKIVSLFHQMNKYVAAAILLLVLSVGGNILLRIKQEKVVLHTLHTMNIDEELADVSNDEIMNYLNQGNNKNMEYLMKPNQFTFPASYQNEDASDNDDNIKETSNKEILQFLLKEDQGF